MTEEEKKAVEHLEKRLLAEKYTKNIGTPVNIKELKITLDLIKRQEAELEKKNKIINKKLEQTEDDTTAISLLYQITELLEDILDEKNNKIEQLEEKIDAIETYYDISDLEQMIKNDK